MGESVPEILTPVDRAAMGLAECETTQNWVEIT